MSVLKAKRGVSSMEYVKVADQISQETLRFLTRLSARYDRLLSPKIMEIASDLADYTVKANSIYPSDQVKFDERKLCLLRAKECNSALDRQLRLVYELLMLNPQGCFTGANGKTVSPSKAVQLLDNMAESLGSKIDREEALLRGVLENDRKAWKAKNQTK